MQHIIALSHSAVIVRHWFEIDLDDASMEHGARIELRELARSPRRGSESAAQLVTADRPLWRADLFDRLTDEPGTFGVAHYHPEFSGNEPGPRVFDPELTARPWTWLHHQIAGRGAAPAPALDPEDAAELAPLAGTVVTPARQVSPERCASAARCHQLTTDARQSVQLMISGLKRPDLLDTGRTRLWQTAVQVTAPDRP